jgi:hypothetical protein
MLVGLLPNNCSVHVWKEDDGLLVRICPPNRLVPARAIDGSSVIAEKAYLAHKEYRADPDTTSEIMRLSNENAKDMVFA